VVEDRRAAILGTDEVKVAILGAGGVGLGMAALMSSKNIDVRLWAPSPTGVQTLLDGKPIVSTGVLEGEFRASVNLDMAKAIEGADAIIVAVPGNGHKAVIDLLAPHVSADQLIAISSHMSLSALYLSRQLSHRGAGCPISAWATTAVAGRRISPGETHIASVRQHIVASTVRPEDNEDAARVLTRIFGDVFEPASDVMAATLTNVNPATHLAVALCNLTRMEYGEEWGSYRGISSAVGRLIERLDSERLNLASRFGLSVQTVQEHLHESFGLPLGSVAEMAAEQDIRRNGAPMGPATLEHRYVTEDVPFGIVPLVKFGKIAGVAMPLHEAGLALIGALYGRSFVAENDILPHLDIDNMSPEELLALCRKGYSLGPR
jgi:opine dehydrogenase